MLLGFAEKFNNSDKDLLQKVEKMNKQIEAVGGKLTFVMKIGSEGWFADCQEFPAIITGGINTNPTEEEIVRSIIESIKTAFDVPIGSLEKIEKSPNRIASFTRPRIKLEREFQLA